MDILTIWISICGAKYDWKLFELLCFHLPIVITSIAWMEMECWNVARNFLSYHRLTVMHFMDQNWILKIRYCIRYVMDCKIFLWSEFLDIPEKSCRIRRRRKLANTKCFAFQANTIISINQSPVLHSSQYWGYQQP